MLTRFVMVFLHEYGSPGSRAAGVRLFGERNDGGRRNPDFFSPSHLLASPVARIHALKHAPHMLLSNFAFLSFTDIIRAAVLVGFQLYFSLPTRLMQWARAIASKALLDSCSPKGALRSEVSYPSLMPTAALLSPSLLTPKGVTCIETHESYRMLLVANHSLVLCL
jgi:hypothetical protein